MQPPPASIAEAVSRELLGERILWAASPDRWAYASRYWKTALFGIPFAAFAIFWTYQASHIPAKVVQGLAVFFPLWGLMFVLFGLTMLLSPLWAAWTAGSVYYVVTVVSCHHLREKTQAQHPIVFAVGRFRVRPCLKRWRWREHHFSENRGP